MQGVRIGIVSIQRQREATATTFLTLNADKPLVQLSERLDQCQPYARPRSLMVTLGLIVAFEDVWQRLWCNAVARVSHGNAQFAVSMLHRRRDATLVGIFDGIRQEIVHDGSNDFRVEPYHRQSFSYVAGYLYFGISIQLLVVEAYLAYKLSYVSSCYRQPPILCFGFPELQYFVDKVSEAFGTFMNHRHMMATQLRQSTILHQVVKRSEDKCQWSAQFVSHISKESQAFLVHLLFLLTLTPFQFQFVAQFQFAFVGPYHITDEGKGQEEVNDIRPPSTPERWLYDDAELRLFGLIPILTPQFRAEYKCVMTWLQPPEHHVVVVANVIPLAVHAFHHVRVVHQVSLCEVTHGKSQA